MHLNTSSYSTSKLFVLGGAIGVLLLASSANAVLVHEYSASLDVPGNGSWTDEVGLVNLTFTGGTTSPVDVSGNSSYFSAAYAFGGSTTGGSAGTSWNTVVGSSSSYEMWIRPNAIPVGTRQTLLEIGNPFRGLSFSLDTDGSILALLKEGSTNSLPNIVLNTSDVSSLLTSGEFVQVVLTVDKNDPGSGIQTTGTLYVNGGQQASLTFDGDIDLVSSNPGGIARFYYDQMGGAQRDAGNPYSQNTFSNYEGEISLLRLYDNAMTAGEVQAAYDSIAIPEPQTYWLVGGIGALLFIRGMVRRKRS